MQKDTGCSEYHTKKYAKESENMTTENQKEENRENTKKEQKLRELLLLLVMAASGFLFAMAACFFAHAHFGMYLWPLIACTDVFVFSSVGFFLEEGYLEIIYEVCSVISFACLLLQLVVLF